MRHVTYLTHQTTIFLVISLISIFAFPSTVLAQTDISLKPNSAAENWVLEKIAAGEIADLSEQFPNEADRTLSAKFLVNLLDGYTAIPVTRYGVHIHNAIFADPIILKNIEVDHDLFLRNCMFKDYIDISEGSFHKNLSFSGSVFSSSVNFYSLEVGRTLSIDNATFENSVDLSYVHIGKTLDVDFSQFTNPSQNIYFNNMKIDNDVSLRNSSFAGPTDFSYSEIGGNFSAHDAQFNKVSSFGAIRVAGNLFITNAVFSGPVLFNYADIGITMEAVGTQFNSGDVGFNSLHTSKSFFLDEAIFSGGVDFGYSIIGEDLRLENTKFVALDKTISFEGVRVSGAFVLQNTSFSGLVSFLNSDFTAIYWNNVNWPDEKENHIIVDQMVYRDIYYIKNGRDSWDELILLIGLTNYNRETYTTLENTFIEKGYPERADHVYIAYKRRERSEALTQLSLQWWWSSFLDIFVLYGRSPERAFLWGAFIVLVGFFVFHDEKEMVPQKKRGYRKATMRTIQGIRIRTTNDHLTSNYSPFWYSLDLFIPFVNLGVADQWMPNHRRKVAQHYQRIQILLGWILIPIALLAISGLIE